MKKTLFILLALFLSIAILACDLTSTSGRTTTASTTTSVPTSSDTTTSTSLSTSAVTTTTTATTTTSTTTTTTTTATTTTTTSTTTTTTTTNNATPLIPSGYSLLQDELDVVGIPSLGEQKILVFAVDFSDYPASTSGVSIADLNVVFNGADNEVAFESLNSYYFKSSFGKLDLTADIYGYYRASHPASYYEDEYEKLYATDAWGDPLYSDDEVTYPDSDLIFELLSYYDSTIDYTEYDGNNDGYIDGVFVVNTAPVSYDYGSDLWWAYQDIYIYEGDIFDSNAEPYYFVWLGTDFFLEGNEGLNARTIIHETGHMLGLEDYYDYDPYSTYNDGGLGGADMMDDAVGDHNPFSKILLGWITPLVVTTSMTIDLTPFIINGEVILIIDQWNNTIFDEYLLISLYTPAGLNQMDQAAIFTVSGMVVYHVNGSIANGTPVNTVYPSLFDTNNSDTRYKLIQIVEADGDGDIDQYSDAENSDLFQQNRTLSWQVSQTFSWDRGGLPDRLTILFSVVNNSSATLTITIPQ